MMAIQFPIIYHNNGEIDKMHNGMHHAVNGDKNAGHFMHIDVIIQWQECTKTTRSHKCDALTQHQHKHKGTIKIQTLT